MFSQFSVFWNESLEFFKWSNFRLFLLATLNNYKRSASIIIRYCWWVFIIPFIVLYLKGAEELATPFSYSLILYFFFLLTVRPSIEKKNLAYFLKHINKFPGYFLVYLMMYIPFMLIFKSTTYLITPFLLASLFFFDLKPTFKNIGQAIKNVIKVSFYFFPVMFFLMFTHRFFNFFMENVAWTKVTLLLNQGSNLGLNYCVTFIIFLFELLLVSAVAIYYVKIKHNYHKMFFGP